MYVLIMANNDERKALADTPPGPALSTLLARFDPAHLAADEAIPMLRAWSRQRAHDHARLAATMARVAALSRHITDPEDWAGAEIAAALTWSEAKTGRELEFAETLAGLPQVATAFDTGRIDHGKAWVFTDVLGAAKLSPAQTEAVCTLYVPLAPGLTAGQLRHRLLWAVLAVDPEWAGRRYRRAVAGRRVCGYLGADGTATITASGLPAGDAAAACARVDTLAEQLIRAGYPGTLNQIRAEVFVRLLDGRLTGLNTQQIITTLLADTTSAPADPTGGGPAAAADPAGAEPAGAEPAGADLLLPTLLLPTLLLPTLLLPTLASTRWVDRARAIPAQAWASIPNLPVVGHRPGSRSASASPLCSGSTTAPPISPAGDRCYPRSPAPSSPANSTAGGASPSSTRAATSCSLAPSAADHTPTPSRPPPCRPRAASSSCTSPPPTSRSSPRTPTLTPHGHR